MIENEDDEEEVVNVELLDEVIASNTFSRIVNNT